MRQRALGTAVCGLAVGLAAHAAAAQDVRMFWVAENGDPADFSSGTSIVPAHQGEHVCLEIWLQGIGSDFPCTAAQAFVDDRAVSLAGGSIAADCDTAAFHAGHPQDPGFTFNAIMGNNCGESDPMNRLGWFRTVQGPSPPVFLPLSKFIGLVKFQKP